ncbi:MAG TPA: hypothetical protein VEB22_11310 [Phycisphaerales bacterium]|nr:hypothetical protein [Phycisphaerales bacterium]
MRALLALVLLASCGSITTSSLTDPDAGDAGELGDAIGTAGTTGAAGVGGLGGGAGAIGGAGTTGAGGAGGQGGACVSANAPGFAFGPGCDAGACRATCELEGAHFVGCVVDSPIASRCYARCSDCP